MRILVVAARAPRADGKGDQVRLAGLLPALCAAHEVTLLVPRAPGKGAPPGPPPPGAPRHQAVTVSRAGRARAALAGWLAGRPGQVGWFRPRALVSATRRLAHDADLVVFVTARTAVRLPGTPTAVDHIDALSLNARRRGRAARRAPVRALWAIEARRLRRWERRVAAGVRAQVVTSPEDARALPPWPAPAVVANAAPAGHARAAGAPERPRDIDLILTGNMRYPPNRDAAAFLAGEILPRLRRGRDVRALVAGRHADSLPPAPGLEVASDVPSLVPYLCRAKVAIAPLRIGTGVPNKALEAAAAGAALVLTPSANAALGFGPQAAEVAETADALAAAVERLLASAELRARRAEAMTAELARFAPDALGRRYAQALTAGPGG